MSSKISNTEDRWRVECPGLEEKVTTYLALPDLGVPQLPNLWFKADEIDHRYLGDWESCISVTEVVDHKYQRISQYFHPEPGASFDYEG